MIGGLAALAARYRVQVVGGNLTRSPGPLFIDVTVSGTVKRRQVLTRSGARPGDELYVTGSIGAAAAGLQMLKAGSALAGPESCVTRFLYPEPRVQTGKLLGRNRAAGACVDLSDGLADAIHRLAERSGVGAVIDADALPIEAALREWFETRGADPIVAAITGGDDYELLFTAPPRRRVPSEISGVPVSCIGEITRGTRVSIVSETGKRWMLKARGWQHFRHQ
jgi:thiamine-monophosphate kinase